MIPLQGMEAVRTQSHLITENLPGVFPKQLEVPGGQQGGLPEEDSGVACEGVQGPRVCLCFAPDIKTAPQLYVNCLGSVGEGSSGYQPP